MEWAHATLRLENPHCDAASALGGDQRLRCMQRGPRPLAHLDHGGLPGWSCVQTCQQGAYLQRDGACEGCPISRLPAGVLPVDVEVYQGGLTVTVAYPDDASLADAYHHFRLSGEVPRVHRSSRPAQAPSSLVDLSSLSPKQLLALKTAAQIGYFRPGEANVDALAEAMQCSRSTAHEHLRRAMDRLLTELF